MPLDALRFSSLDLREQGGLRAVRELGPGAFESLGVGASAEGPVAVELEFSLGGQEILLQGKVRGRWKLRCDRCLAPAVEPFESAFERVYPATEAALDASEDVRETLALAIPFKALCRPDCKGLCPSCGQNLNAGSCGCKRGVPGPFSKLKDLKNARKKSDAS